MACTDLVQRVKSIGALTTNAKAIHRYGQTGSQGSAAAVLIHLSRLGISVPMLLHDALLVTDQRHCAALRASLDRHDQCLVAFLRCLGKAAGHDIQLCVHAPNQHQPNCSGCTTENANSDGTTMFSKIVSSFHYYCQHSARFREQPEDRQRHVKDVQQTLRAFVKDVVAASDPLAKDMCDQEADQYLQEWHHRCNAEMIMREAYGSMSRHCLFSFHDGTGTAKEAIHVYSSIIKLQEFVEGIPLLAALSGKVIRHEN